MIASLTGIVQFKGLDRAVIDVHGVGYLVAVSLQTLGAIPDVGQTVSLQCYTHVREDALALYGFAQAKEREIFEILIGVSGVGPKLALTILSGLEVHKLIQAVTSADHGRLQSIPGVGKKTAERLVVELKDKFAKLTLDSPTAATAGGASQTEVVEALVGLGYKRNLAERAVDRAVAQSAEPQRPEQLLRRALSLVTEL